MIQIFELGRTPSSKECFQKRDYTSYLGLGSNVYLRSRGVKWFYSDNLNIFKTSNL